MKKIYSPLRLTLITLILSTNTHATNQTPDKGLIDDFIEYVGEFFHISSKPKPKPKFNYDATLVGFVNFADGIGRHPILFKDCLDKTVKLNFLSTRNIPPTVEDAQLSLPRLDQENKADVGAVAILTDILADKALNIYQRMPDSPIKIAYTMFESTEIPKNWVAILNKKFDMAVVPDQFLVEVYQECGVEIPVFVLPLPLMLQDFLQMKNQHTPHKPFTFGFSGGLWKRKNHLRVIDAFAQEFGSDDNVKLILHGRFGEPEIIKAINDKIIQLNLTNVEFVVGPYTHEEYLNFFKSIDCYVSLSMGEGFSITPREALACAKPCIISNNTAQATICNTGSVRIIESTIPVPAFYDSHYTNAYIMQHGLDQIKNFNYNFSSLNKLLSTSEEGLEWRSGEIGLQFDCATSDVRVAMRDIYQNYDAYKTNARHGQEWVKQYLAENLHALYVNLIKPKTIKFDTKNSITKDGLTTNSESLYKKYKAIAR